MFFNRCFSIGSENRVINVDRIVVVHLTNFLVVHVVAQLFLTLIATARLFSLAVIDIFFVLFLFFLVINRSIVNTVVVISTPKRPPTNHRLPRPDSTDTEQIRRDRVSHAAVPVRKTVHFVAGLARRLVADHRGGLLQEDYW